MDFFSEDDAAVSRLDDVACGIASDVYAAFSDVDIFIPPDDAVRIGIFVVSRFVVHGISLR